MASDIQISALTATGGVGNVVLLAVWDQSVNGSCLPYMQPAKYRWYAAESDNWFAATQIGETVLPLFTHTAQTPTAGHFYWTVPVDSAGNEGALYPADPFGGVYGEARTVGATDIGAGAITGDKIADDAIGTQHFEPGVTPVEIVSSLPFSGNYPGRMVFFTVDNKLYRWTGSGWTASVAVVDLLGQIASTQIADNSISTPKLQANSVATNNLQAGSVTANQMAANSVVANAIVAGAVSAGKIAASAVSATELQAGAVIAGKINSGAINTSALFVNGVVITDVIAANAVTNGDVQINTNTANFTTSPITFSSITVSSVPSGAQVILIATLNINYHGPDSGAFGILRLTIVRGDGTVIGFARDINVDDSWSGLQTWSGVDRSPVAGSNTYNLTAQAIGSGATLQHYGGGGTLLYLLGKR